MLHPIFPISVARRSETRSFFDHLRRYPNVESLILDCSTWIFPDHIRYLNICDNGASGITAINEEDTSRIRRLRIHLTPRFVDAPTFLRIVQMVEVPNIRELHVAFDEITLDEDWSYAIAPKVWAVQAWTDLFARLTSAAANWDSLEVIKVCARVDLKPGELAVWNLWVCTTQRAFPWQTIDRLCPA
jgi:hypothetical protein